MNHSCAEPVDFTYNRDELQRVMFDIVKQNKLFERRYTIFALPHEQHLAVLSVLGLKHDTEMFGVKIQKTVVGCLYPKQQSKIHIDVDESKVIPLTALNLPVTRCNDVIMNWYSVKPGCHSKTFISPKGLPVPLLDHSMSTCIFSLQCNEPLIVNPSMFHDIVNNSNENQIAISIRACE